MAKEIERKFLVFDDSYRAMATEKIEIAQGYISRRKDGTARVRIFGEKGYLTVKSSTIGISRNEWEYEIPVADAYEMLESVCEPGIIAKTRYIVELGGYRWEVDEFQGALAPLVLAEVELPSEEEWPELPPFVGAEVSDDPEYFNSNLSRIAAKGGSES